MDPALVALIVELVAQGAGALREVRELAQRAEAGEHFSNEELAAKRKEARKALDRWNAAADKDRA